MKFKNYCIIIMGVTKGCKTEIVKISEDTPRFMEAKGVTIATFLSVAEPGELTEYFKSFDRNFLVFELDKNVSGFNLTNNKIQELLFGHLREIDQTKKSNKFVETSNRLIDEINKNRDEVNLNLDSIKVKSGVRYNITDDMSKVEMTNIINKILDKGPDNFTEHDKKVLKELSQRTGQMK